MPLKIAVRTLRTADGQRERLRTDTTGTLTRQPYGWRVEYTEFLGGQAVLTALTLTAAGAELRRAAPWETVLPLTPGQPQTGTYATPYGVLPARTDTSLVRFDLTPAGGRVTLRYTLDLGGQTADFEVHILIR